MLAPRLAGGRKRGKVNRRVGARSSSSAVYVGSPGLRGRGALGFTAFASDADSLASCCMVATTGTLTSWGSGAACRAG